VDASFRSSRKTSRWRQGTASAWATSQITLLARCRVEKPHAAPFDHPQHGGDGARRLAEGRAMWLLTPMADGTRREQSASTSATGRCGRKTTGSSVFRCAGREKAAGATRLLAPLAAASPRWARGAPREGALRTSAPRAARALAQPIEVAPDVVDDDGHAGLMGCRVGGLVCLRRRTSRPLELPGIAVPASARARRSQQRGQSQRDADRDQHRAATRSRAHRGERIELESQRATVPRVAGDRKLSAPAEQIPAIEAGRRHSQFAGAWRRT